MAAVITYEDVVNASFPSTVSQDEVDLLIEVISEADECLDGANVSLSKQKILKIYAVRHMLFMQSNGGKGSVTSEHAPSGASRSYSAWRGVGVGSSPYGTSLKQLDSSNCIVNLLQSDGPFLSALSIGGCRI